MNKNTKFQTLDGWISAQLPQRLKHFNCVLKTADSFAVNRNTVYRWMRKFALGDEYYKHRMEKHVKNSRGIWVRNRIGGVE